MSSNEPKKIGITIDDYKKRKFKRALSAAGFGAVDYYHTKTLYRPGVRQLRNRGPRRRQERGYFHYKDESSLSTELSVFFF